METTQLIAQMASYLELDSKVSLRLAKALKALESPSYMDDGLEGIFSLIDVILGKLKRGERASIIVKSLSQSKYG
jgi:hypothetical protein